MYGATTKGEGNAADGRFSTACEGEDDESNRRKRKIEEDEEGSIFSYATVHWMRILRSILSPPFWMADRFSHWEDAIPALCHEAGRGS
jgi:hypothetical protein